MTYITIFGFEYEGDVADSILLHHELGEAQARGKAWLGEKEHSYDYMKIMCIAAAGATEVERMEWAW